MSAKIFCGFGRAGDKSALATGASLSSRAVRMLVFVLFSVARFLSRAHMVGAPSCLRNAPSRVHLNAKVHSVLLLVPFVCLEERARAECPNGPAVPAHTPN